MKKRGAGMSRFEVDAREVLLRRRRSLRQGGGVMAGPADPAARWRDYESVPPSMNEPTRRELEDIDAALARLDAGRYGACLACGGPIGLQRLRAIPEARYCMACSGQRHTAE